MNLSIASSALILLLPFNAFAEIYVEFSSAPLLLLTSVELEKLPGISATKAFEETYQSLIEDADAVLADKPIPLKEIIYEGHVSNHPDRLNSVKHLRDMIKISNLAWAYCVSGNPVYSAKAIAFIEAWAKTYKASGNNVNDNKMLSCMIAYYLLQKEMTQSQQLLVRTWIKTIGDAQRKKWTDRGGNRPAKQLKLIYLAAYLDNDQPTMDWVEGKIQYVWNATLFEDGQTHDFKKRDALHYHMSSIKEFLEIAQIGRLSGKDHYNQEADNGGSIAKAIAFAMPYIKGEKNHPEWVHSTVKLDHQRAESGDPYYKPGKPWDPWGAYRALLLAVAFDDALLPLAEELRRDKKEALPWLAVLAKASLP